MSPGLIPSTLMPSLALIGGRPQSTLSNPDGGFELFRIGDAVASRNIRAAIYDALCLGKDV